MTSPTAGNQSEAGQLVDVILPTLDEAATLPRVLTRMPAGYRAFVVDNGSTDGSVDVARAHGAVVVAEPRQGFGAACYAGLMAARSPVVAFMDADVSLDPLDLDVLCAPVLRRNADLLLSARTADGGAWPWPARLANRWLAAQIRRRAEVAITDLGPMRAVNRETLIGLDMAERGFAWPLEMVLKAAGAGFRIEERPVRYRPRIGRSKVIGTVRGTLRAAHDMSRPLGARR